MKCYTPLSYYFPMVIVLTKNNHLTKVCAGVKLLKQKGQVFLSFCELVIFCGDWNIPVDLILKILIRN